MITDTNKPLAVVVRGLEKFRVPDRRVQAIAHAGAAARVYWTVDHSQNNPQNRGHQVDPMSELYIVGVAPGTDFVELTLEDGGRRRVAVAVVPE